MVVPQIIHFNRNFHYKSSILGYPYFWKHPSRMPTTAIGCKRPCWNEFRRGVVLRHHNLRETLQSSSNCSEMRAAVLFVFCASLSDPTTSVTSCGQDRLLIQNHNISHLCRFHLDCCPEQHQYHQKGTENIARIPGVSEALTPLPPNFPTGQLQHF